MAHALTAMPHSDQVDIVLRTQLSDLSETLQAQIRGLAENPEPLTSLLDSLCSPLLYSRIAGSYLPKRGAGQPQRAGGGKE